MNKGKIIKTYGLWSIIGLLIWWLLNLHCKINVLEKHSKDCKESISIHQSEIDTNQKKIDALMAHFNFEIDEYSPALEELGVKIPEGTITWGDISFFNRPEFRKLRVIPKKPNLVLKNSKWVVEK